MLFFCDRHAWLQGLFPPCLAAAMLFGLAFPASPGSVQSIAIATEGARPPFNYLENDKPAGFEIDLAQDLCARMKVTCTFVTQDWDGLIPGLLAHRYDAIMAAMEITPEASQEIAFSKPYVRMPWAFLALKGVPAPDTSPSGLAGKTVGVEAGGPQEAYAQDLYTQSQIRPYASLEEAVLDLAEGRADVVLAAKDVIASYMKKRKEAQCCVIVADVPHDPSYSGEGIGIGLRKEDKALKAMFDKALDACMADGTFTRLSAKYFGFLVN